MPSVLEFWFDLSSPYAYFAAEEVEALAARHDRIVTWRPFLLGVAYQRTGMKPLTEQDLRGVYAARDWARLGRMRHLPFVLPARFPMRTQSAARMVYAVDAEDSALAARFATALFRAAFGAGAQIDEPPVAGEVGATLGLDFNRLLRFADDPHWKDVLRERCAGALDKGVFGSPFLVVDGEPFWGADRLPMVDQWLSRGGW